MNQQLNECFRSGQMSAAQIESHRSAGELPPLNESDLGVEAALPSGLLKKPARSDTSWAPYIGVAVALIGAIAAYVFVVAGPLLWRAI